MRLSAWRAIAALLLVAAAATPAAAIVGGSAARGSDRVARATVFITALTPSGRNRAQIGNCTGILIERQLVLTAGHCLSDLGGPSLVVAQFYDSSKRVARTIQVAAGALHPDYAGRASSENPRPELLGADLAVLRLAEPAPADRQPIAIARDSVAASKAKSVLFGAGLRVAANEASAGQLRIARVSAQVVTTGPTAVALGAAGGSICRGDSGGPVVSNEGLWGVVIAIVRRKNLCNSTVFMAVIDQDSRGFRNMVSRARRGG